MLLVHTHSLIAKHQNFIHLCIYLELKFIVDQFYMCNT